MIDKFKNFFNKENYYSEDKPDKNNKIDSNSYYDGPENDVFKEEFPTHSNCRKLKKENEKLKSDFQNQVLEKFKNRRTIRKFSDQEVPRDTIYNIIEAGLNAPVAGNIQNYKIIVITDNQEKIELGKIAFQQYWLSEAPVILVIVRDNHELSQLYPQEGEIYSIQNTASLIENIIMMAHFYDLGTCWVEAYDNQVLKENLNIPMELKVDAIIPIGYPLEEPHIQKDKTDSKIFFEKFGNRNRT